MPRHLSQPPGALTERSPTAAASSRALRWMLVIAVAAVAVRLIALDQPFVDSWSWRNSLLGMIAENFYRNGFNILYPQVSMAGQAPGYTGMEFPLMAFIAALLYPVFGVQEWIGRLISVVFFAAAVPCFFSVVRRVANERTALFAVALFGIAPLSVFASRSFMNDMPCVSLSIIAVYLFARWLDAPEHRGVLVAATVVTALAFLVKLTAMIVGVPLLYMGWRRYGFRLLRRPELWGFALGALVPSVLWWLHEYWVSQNHFPYELWGFQHGFKPVTVDRWMRRLVLAFTEGVTPLVGAAMLLGLPLRGRGEFRYLFHWWLVGVVLFWIASGRAFAMHSWYGLPLVPVAAAFAGQVFDRVAVALEARSVPRLVRAALGVALFGYLVYSAYGYVRPRYTPWAAAYREAGIELRAVAPAGALVVFASAGDPTGAYYSGLKGCNYYSHANAERDLWVLEGLRREGVRYVVFTADQSWWLDQRPEVRAYLEAEFPQVSDRGRYVIYGSPEAPATPAASGAPTAETGTDATERCGCTEYGYECFAVEGTRIRRREPPLLVADG